MANMNLTNSNNQAKNGMKTVDDSLATNDEDSIWQVRFFESLSDSDFIQAANSAYCPSARALPALSLFEN